MKIHLVGLGLFLTAAVCLAAASAGPAPATTTTSTAPADPARTAMLAQLGDSDFARREAAQQQLDALGWRDLEFLQRSADAAANPEIKARLAGRIQAIKEDLALNPPPISVNLKDATIIDVAAALSLVIDEKLDIWPPNDIQHPAFCTLSATDKPFWEVFTALSRQSGLKFQDIGNQLRLVTDPSGGWRSAVIVGPVAIFPLNLTRQRTADLQKAPGAEVGDERLTLSCEVVVDPRMHIIQYTPPEFTDITDDAGNVLLAKANVPRGGLTRVDAGGRKFAQSLSASLALPAKKGTRIASARGSVSFVVQTAEESIDIADVEKKTGQSFAIGNLTVSVPRFNIQGNAMNISISTNSNAPGVNFGNSSPVNATLTDATGKTVFHLTVQNSMGYSTGGGDYAAPFKLHLSAPTKTKELTVPFELKDLPIP